MSDLREFAVFAEQLADAARAEALCWSEAEWAVEDKGAGAAFDPVTRADRAVEGVLRDMIAARWPDHGIEGEEFGARPAIGPFRWSLDPIDGTSAFICGLPTWTVLIALLEHDQPVLGIIDAPRLGERFVGFGDVGYVVTATRRTPLRTSGCRAVCEGRLSTTDPYLFPPPQRDSFERVREKAQLTRYGLDGYGYARLAAGGLDLIVESGLAPHDWRALLPIVRAAGGAVSDWSGGAEFSTGQLVAAASPELLLETVSLLGLAK